MLAQQRLPDWIKAKLPGGPNYVQVKNLLRSAQLHTVCEEAHCPNIGECFESRTATFLILGDTCTRNCGFCAISTGRPLPTDPQEPERVAATVKHLGLKHAVITSVTRDDLPDGGAAIYAATIERIRQLCPGCRTEVLIPDFRGSRMALEQVVRARPDILNHNIETVPRLYHQVRPQADYTRSLELLRRAKEVDGAVLTKSGIMVGLGETWQELLETYTDLRVHGCDILTIGQYLRPSREHLAIARFYPPEEFRHLEEEAKKLGFLHVESGPLVRSSYHAYRHGAPREES